MHQPSPHGTQLATPATVHAAAAPLLPSHSICQSTGGSPDACSSRLVAEKWRQPRKPCACARAGGVHCRGGGGEERGTWMVSIAVGARAMCVDCACVCVHRCTRRAVQQERQQHQHTRCADSGEGCADLSTWWRLMSMPATRSCAYLQEWRKHQWQEAQRTAAGAARSRRMLATHGACTSK